MTEQTDQAERSKVVTWSDTAEGLAALPTVDGLDFLKRMVTGEIAPPPISAHFNMEVVAAESGSVTFRCHPDESHYNPIGTVHGGLVCTLLDSVLGCATQTTLPAGMGYTSIEIKVNYLRGVTSTSGPLTAVGRVTKPGRRVAFAEGEVVDKDGRIVATASGSCLVFPLETMG